MTEEKEKYRVLWQSAIDSDPTRLREDEFTSIQEVARFVDGLKASRHRTFVRLMHIPADD